jgi:hypothetical protein
VKTRPVLRLFAATVLLLLVGVVAAAAEEAPATRLYLRNDGGGCPGTPFLSATPGTEDVNCGYIHGAPLGEAYSTAGESAGQRLYSTLTEEGTYALDASRDIAGKLTIRNGRTAAAVPTRTGVGEVVVDLTLTGEQANGTTLPLGSITVKGTAVPDTPSFEIPFSFDLDPALGEPVLSGISLETNVRGLHLYSGYTGANDTSWFDVPVVPAVETGEQTPAP